MAFRPVARIGQGWVDHWGGEEEVREYVPHLLFQMVSDILKYGNSRDEQSPDTTASISPPYLSKTVPLLSPSSTGKLEVNSYPRTTLNALYADVGLIKPIVQCSEADGICDAMKTEVPLHDGLGIWGIERSRWKFVLDLGGHWPRYHDAKLHSDLARIRFQWT